MADDLPRMYTDLADWFHLLSEVGFQASVRPFEHSELPPDWAEAFVGVKPLAPTC
jgi:hypothetical protein